MTPIIMLDFQLLSMHVTAAYNPCTYRDPPLLVSGMGRYVSLQLITPAMVLRLMLAGVRAHESVA
jgi:hypothetical protein